MTTQDTQRQPDLAEERRRMAVFAKTRKTVLVKFGTRLDGVDFKDRDDAAINRSHTQEAQARNLDPHAYRGDVGGTSDTGYQVCNRQSNVSIARFIQELMDMGLKPTNVFWQPRKGKPPVTTVTFSTEGEEIELPDSVLRAITLVFGSCTVWANLRYNDPADPSKGQYRLDTINVDKPVKLDEPPTYLIVAGEVGNTYRLQK